MPIKRQSRDPFIQGKLNSFCIPSILSVESQNQLAWIPTKGLISVLIFHPAKTNSKKTRAIKHAPICYIMPSQLNLESMRDRQ